MVSFFAGGENPGKMEEDPHKFSPFPNDNLLRLRLRNVKGGTAFPFKTQEGSITTKTDKESLASLLRY